MNSIDIRKLYGANVSRRGFLGGAGGVVAGAVVNPWLAGAGRAANGGRDVMVHVQLRGGIDGLSLCVPYGDNFYYSNRPNLAIPQPGQPGGAVDLDGFFGLPPAAASLQTPYSNGHLAIVHATGSTDPTRSHFDAMQFMEYGIPEQPLGTVTDGWLARHLLVTSSLGGPLRGSAFNVLMPTTLAGGPQTLPIPDMALFDLYGPVPTTAARRAALTDMFMDEPAPSGPAALGSFDAIDVLGGIDFENYVPSNGANYPATPFGDAFAQTAAVIKADIGVEAVMLELDGWDTHDQQGPQNGYMAGLMNQLALTLQAFYLDMLQHVDCYTMLLMSEFGRRVAENGALGTDHGHGNVILAMGGGIAGGQVLTQWPGLAPGNLYDGEDLDITIDYRDIVAEILERRMDNPDLASVFPNYTPTFRGVTV